VKPIAFLFFSAFIGKWAPAQVKPVDAGSSVQFKIKNLGFTIDGSFTGLQGNIRFDPSHLADAVFDVSIDANTVNTDNSLRDDHLRNEDYFDVKHYPLIHFVSSKVTPSNKANALFIFGKLTIKNQTKDVSFPFTATASDHGWLFAGTFTMNRRDFGVGGASIIADKLDVSLNVLAK
jgi:polyisoprenoid-binding protein YceI